jgi:hypothetical protein
MAKADFDAAAHEFNAQRQVLVARLRDPRPSIVIGSGAAIGFLAALFPLRAWPKFAVNAVRVGVTLARLPVASALVALASKKYLRGAQPGSRVRSD